MKKKIVVQKYGGSSVANAQKMENVANRIVSYIKKGCNIAVVVSAMGDTTNELIELAKQINPNPCEREMDMLMSTGEQISTAILAMAIHKKGFDAISFTGSQVGILTDQQHTKAKIIKIETKKIEAQFDLGRVVIIAGFQGRSKKDEITTLGRGGSDLSAVALAVALKADVCEIYTDVDGIFTADPRIVKDARKQDFITFDEMLELAARGAKMHTRAIEVAKKFNMALHVRSSYNYKEGTRIMEKFRRIEAAVVRGVALTEKEAKITLCNVPDRPGVASRIFNELAKTNVNVDMIVQNVSHQNTTDISFTVMKTDLAKAMKISNKISRQIGIGGVLADEEIARVAIVGVGMKSHPGVAASCFAALAKNKINIEMISTSEISISCVIKKNLGKKALIALHKVFGLAKK